MWVQGPLRHQKGISRLLLHTVTPCPWAGGRVHERGWGGISKSKMLGPAKLDKYLYYNEKSDSLLWSFNISVFNTLALIFSPLSTITDYRSVDLFDRWVTVFQVATREIFFHVLRSSDSLFNSSDTLNNVLLKL